VTRIRKAVAGASTEVIELGNGPPLLFLHAGEGPLTPNDRYLRELAKSFRVIAPWHPGFGPSELPHDFRDVGDLAYFHLELAEHYRLEQAVLCGASFGGWIAAEMAVRDPRRFSSLVLADAFGIKVGDRETRDIADFFAMGEEDLRRATYHRPEIAVRDTTKLSDDELTGIARSREALCYYGWQPFMHNPQLKRWLSRIRMPTLVLWGADDRITNPDYGRAYAAAIPGARFELIDEAGHHAHVEQPEVFARHVAAFAKPR
jgi:pimeloyl-ACP methyl ester carboxylesterase